MQLMRCRFLFAATMVMLLGSSVPSRAQIIYPYPPYRYVSADASVRVEVTPREAQVYVDGYYAGIVDDFDGVFQRLHTAPGQHEITIYLDGYRSFRQQVYLMPDKTFVIKEALEKLGPGEAAEARPVPTAPPVEQGPQVQGAPPQQAPTRRLPGPRRGRGGPPDSNSPTTAPAPGAQAGTGTLAIQLQPADADVLIDGQPWSNSDRTDRVMVDLSEGRHVVQARKAGYVGYLTEIQVRGGQTTTITISLRAQP